MKVTRVKYKMIELSGKMNIPLAICDVVLDDCLKVKGIKLFEGSRGKYIVFPGTRVIDLTSVENKDMNGSTLKNRCLITEDDVFTGKVRYPENALVFNKSAKHNTIKTVNIDNYSFQEARGEEHFHPISTSFAKELTDIIVLGFNKVVDKGLDFYSPLKDE